MIVTEVCNSLESIKNFMRKDDCKYIIYAYLKPSFSINLNYRKKKMLIFRRQLKGNSLYLMIKMKYN